MAMGSEITGIHRQTRPKPCESALIGARGYSSKGSPRGATPHVLCRTVTRWDHGFGGVAHAHDSRSGTGLAVLAVTGTGRTAREHLGQSRRTVLACRDVPVPVRRPAGQAPGATRPATCRRGDHRRRVGTAFPAPEPADRTGQTRRARVLGPRPGCRSPPGDQTDQGFEPSASRSQGTAFRDQTAAPEAVGRVAPARTRSRTLFG